MVYPALLPRLPVVDCTDALRQKTKIGFCACAITFQLASTTSPKIKKFYIFPREYLYLLYVRVSGKTSKFSLHNPQRLAFIKEEACVYSAVRPGALNKAVCASSVNLLKPTSYVMHHQFNIQQLYALPTLYLCVLYLSENKQWLVPLTA